MKKPTDIQGLAERLSGAAATPVGAIAVTDIKQPRAIAQKRSSVSVFLRLSPELFAKVDAEAMNRTKATGRGVTVQQVILDKLASAI
jgi:hypothetical protein